QVADALEVVVEPVPGELRLDDRRSPARLAEEPHPRHRLVLLLAPGAEKYRTSVSGPIVRRLSVDADLVRHRDVRRDVDLTRLNRRRRDIPRKPLLGVRHRRTHAVLAGDDLAHADDAHAERRGDRVGLDPRLLDRELHRLGAGAGIVSYAEDDALQLIGACLDAGVDHLADPRKLDDLDADDVACPVTD